jgi:predicted ATP-dependent Lon-type protease
MLSCILTRYWEGGRAMNEVRIGKVGKKGMVLVTVIDDESPIERSIKVTEEIARVIQFALDTGAENALITIRQALGIYR